MNAIRRVQFSAAAVVINGLLALTLMSSTSAVAGSCGSLFAGCVSNCSLAAADCESLTPPGCTYVSNSCINLGDVGPCAHFPNSFTLNCHYQ